MQTLELSNYRIIELIYKNKTFYKIEKKENSYLLFGGHHLKILNIN